MSFIFLSDGIYFSILFIFKLFCDFLARGLNDHARARVRARGHVLGFVRLQYKQWPRQLSW